MTPYVVILLIIVVLVVAKVSADVLKRAPKQVDSPKREDSPKRDDNPEQAETKQEYVHEHERLRTVANIISAGAAVSIPIMLAQIADSSRESERISSNNQQSLKVMIDLNTRLSSLDSEKTRVDRWAGIGKDKAFAYQYIAETPRVRRIVYDILNEYEAVCLAVNQNLLSASIVWAMRGDALIATFKNYKGFIDEHRTKESKNARAWTECMDLVDKLEEQKDRLHKMTEEVKRKRLLRLE